MNQKHNLEYMVNLLQKMLMPPTSFTTATHIFEPDDHDSESEIIIKNTLITEALEVINSDKKYSSKWEAGRRPQSTNITDHINACERDDFLRLDSLLQEIFEAHRSDN